MKRRLHIVIATMTALLLGGLVYAWVCRMLGFGIPCMFYVATGWQCPGCGVSRMCLCLLRLDFQGAFQANPLILVLLPLFVAIGADVLVRYVKQGKFSTKGWSTVAVWILIPLLLIYAVVRNLNL